MEVNLCVGYTCAIKGCFYSIADVFNCDSFDLNFPDGSCESLEVFVECENLAVIAAYDLINAIAKESSSIQIYRFQD